MSSAARLGVLTALLALPAPLPAAILRVPAVARIPSRHRCSLRSDPQRERIPDPTKERERILVPAVVKTGTMKLLLDGIEMASSYTTDGDNVVFTLASAPSAPGDKATLASESRYHRLSVLYEESKLGNQFSGLGQGGLVESAYRYIPIQVGASDYVSMYAWDFSVNPFETPTPAPTNTVTPTPTPGGPTATPTSTGPTPVPSATFAPTYFWNHRRFASLGPQESPTETFIAWVTPTGPTPTGTATPFHMILFQGGGDCAVCNYEKPCEALDCCDNGAALSCPQGNDCGADPTPIIPPEGPPLVSPCSYDNHECNPICSIDNFEGGEMWKRISTAGYKNILVEFDLKAEGLSEIPHGIRPPKSGYRHVDPPRSAALSHTLFLPYQVCQQAEPDNLISCLDCVLIEEVFEVWFTTDYDPPFDATTLLPSFEDEVTDLDGGILRWKLAKALPREILLIYHEDEWRKVTLDFSMQDDSDDNPNFGLWFRCQLDTEENQIQVRNLRIHGQLFPTPTPTPTP